MRIRKEEVKKVIKKLDDLHFMVNDWHTFNMGVYMYMRYGELPQNITDKQLKKIDNILTDSETLFDTYINEEIEDTLNDVELLDENEFENLVEELRDMGVNIN